LRWQAAGLPLLRPSIPIGWRLRLLRDLPTQALAFLAVFVYATQAIAFEWKPGFSQWRISTAPPLYRIETLNRANR